MPLQVVIPDGMSAGDALTVEVSGTCYEIFVPLGCKGGMTIDVDLPSPEPRWSNALPPPPPQSVEVVVPDGVRSGEAFSVEFDGAVFEIICPDGCAAGSAILVDVPAAPPDRGPPPPPAAPTLPSFRTPASVDTIARARPPWYTMPNSYCDFSGWNWLP